VFLIPAVALLSWPIEPLSLSFRKVELGAVAVSVLLTWALVWQGRSSRWRGVVLIAGYVGVASVFFAAGDR
jgi:Ca2+/H+ antiporter